jgi:hypothetical protein
MPEIWTLSGINNQQRANGPFTDYVGAALLQGISSLKPKHIARRYASRLGCLKHYPDPCNVLCLQPDKLLNDEAQTIAIGLHEVMRGVKAGELNGRNIRVILLAPKTNKHPKTQPTELQIYWGSYDAVPNQGIFSSDSLSFWRKWTKKVYPLSATHAIGDYLVAKPKIVKRVKVRLPNHKPTSPRYRYKWAPTGQTAPNVLQTIESWLTALPDDDLVLVGHSQGTNIAMHLLARGMA